MKCSEQERRAQLARIEATIMLCDRAKTHEELAAAEAHLDRRDDEAQPQLDLRAA